MAEAKREGRQGRQGREGRRRPPPRRPRKSRREGQARRARSGAVAGRRRRRPRAMSPRLTQALRATSCAGAGQGVRLQERAGSADDRQDRAQHGRRRSRQRHQEGDVGRRRSRADRRPEAGRHPRAQGDRDLQGAREHADRRQGHAAQDAHVRVPRPPGHDRAAARARLPRPQPEELRRARQLRARHQGAHRVPRDQLRQGRNRSWAWTSSSARRPRPTTRRAPCSRRSISRSGSEARALKRGNRRQTDGEEELDREQQAQGEAGEAIRRPPRAAARRSPTTRR